MQRKEKCNSVSVLRATLCKYLATCRKMLTFEAFFEIIPFRGKCKSRKVWSTSRLVRRNAVVSSSCGKDWREAISPRLVGVR